MRDVLKPYKVIRGMEEMERMHITVQGVESPRNFCAHLSWFAITESEIMGKVHHLMRDTQIV